MNGLEAYKTFLGIGLHFRGTVDGWKYNFSGKCKPETFATKNRLVYMYAKVERDHPTKLAQLMFYYPAFQAYGYVKPDAINLMMKAHKAFIKEFDDSLPSRHKDWLVELLTEGNLTDFFDLFSCTEMLPKFYQLYADKQMTQLQAAILCLCVPELLNTIVSKEPIVFEAWKVKLEFDMKFIQLYISHPVLKQLRDATVEAFKQTATKSKQQH